MNDVRYCNCADPENCIEPVPGYVCRPRSKVPDTPAEVTDQQEKAPFRFVREWFPERGWCRWHDTEFVEAIPERRGQFYCVQCATEARITQKIRPASSLDQQEKA